MNKLIDINDDRDLDAWARVFGITPDELAKLVNELGPSSQRIQEALRRASSARGATKDRMRRSGDE